MEGMLRLGGAAIISVIATRLDFIPVLDNKKEQDKL